MKREHAMFALMALGTLALVGAYLTTNVLVTIGNLAALFVCVVLFLFLKDK